MLIEALSCRQNASDSGIVARIAGASVGADGFLSNMGTEDFLSCLSRSALEGSVEGTPVLPRERVKDTRAALVGHFKGKRFVHPAATFAPDRAALADWLAKNVVAHEAKEVAPGGMTEDEATKPEAFVRSVGDGADIPPREDGYGGAFRDAAE